MALNASALAALIKTNLLANPASGAKDNEALSLLCSSIASAVVQHIQSSAGLVVVTACPAGAGTGTGSVT